MLESSEDPQKVMDKLQEVCSCFLDLLDKITSAHIQTYAL